MEGSDISAALAKLIEDPESALQSATYAVLRVGGDEAARRIAQIELAAALRDIEESDEPDAREVQVVEPEQSARTALAAAFTEERVVTRVAEKKAAAARAQQWIEQIRASNTNARSNAASRESSVAGAAAAPSPARSVSQQPSPAAGSVHAAPTPQQQPAAAKDEEEQKGSSCVVQ